MLHKAAVTARVQQGETPLPTLVFFSTSCVCFALLSSSCSSFSLVFSANHFSAVAISLNRLTSHINPSQFGILARSKVKAVTFLLEATVDCGRPVPDVER